MLTISSGHSASYLTDAVAAGRENYYTGAVTAGEPPGRWYGRGAAILGLAGEVDTQDMTALYERFLDPRDPAFRDRDHWEDAATLGHTGRRYLTEDQLYAAALAAESGADPERRAELRLEAGKLGSGGVGLYVGPNARCRSSSNGRPQMPALQRTTPALRPYADMPTSASTWPNTRPWPTHGSDGRWPLIDDDTVGNT